MKRIYILGDSPVCRVEPEIYGHFTEHIGGVFYDGIWTGEDSDVQNIRGFRKELVDKLKAINPPVIRWPGGCFAETYDWRDGIGPRETRPTRINWWHSLDGRYEPNAIGTHEFVDFCRLVGAEPYIAANITSVTPLDIRDWIDYCNSPAGTTTLARLREANGSREPFGVRYWGVGNETWGGGGNMTGETYAHEFRKYSVVMNNACPGLELICSGANHNDWRWAKDVLEVMSSSEKHMAGLSLHYYCSTAGDPLAFTEEEYYRQFSQALDIGRAIERNWGFVVGYGFEKYARLVVDEWGCWHKNGTGPSTHMKEYGIEPAQNNPCCKENLFEQQSTMRDALVTALTLNIFNNNADKVRMANVAQLCNNLHSLFLAGGNHFICTPTYHVFDLMKGHQSGDLLRVSGDMGKISYHRYDGKDAELPNLSISATRKNGTLTVTIVNLSENTSADIEICPVGFGIGDRVKLGILTSSDPHACNTYENPDTVHAVYSNAESGGNLHIPAASIITLTGSIT